MTYLEYYNKLKTIPITSNEVDIILNLFKNKKPFAFSRFNDGEMMGIQKIGSLVARGDQYIDESLHIKLIQAIEHVQKNYFIGLPCSNCYPEYYSLAKKLIKQPVEYQLNAVILTNRNWIRFITEFSTVIENQNILWISGSDQNLDFLLMGMKLNIISQLKYYEKNTWSQYNHIKQQYIEFIKNKPEVNIVIVSLGPTARVFCKEMFEIDPTRTFVDIGSTFDPFTRNIWHNCHLGWIETGFNYTKKCKICN